MRRVEPVTDPTGGIEFVARRYLAAVAVWPAAITILSGTGMAVQAA